MKLWQKDIQEDQKDIQKKIEHFTIGSDQWWDMYLAKADIIGSLAHAEMLESIGLLTAQELLDVQDGLQDILKNIEKGTFVIEEGVEDIHSQIELTLTKNKGEVGKKIHSGRSRNDQSLVDIKLFLKQEIKDIAHKTHQLFTQLIVLSNQYKGDLLPGYTHFQLAMPSSFGLWFGAYAESLSDDLEVLLASYKVINKNPLGSGAGYGSSFPLNRTKTTELMNFAGLNYNVVYAQMTRGKSEKITAMGLAALAATLSKFSMDVCLYMNQNFGFISFPDVFELIRAKCNRIQALPNELTLLMNNLPSGYHRDMQLTKECLFPAIFELKNCLEMAVLMLRNIIIKKDILKDAKYANLFTVETVNQLVLAGMPFRDAYKKVGLEVEKGNYKAPSELSHTHEGSMGNLYNEAIEKEFLEKMKEFV